MTHIASKIFIDDINWHREDLSRLRNIIKIKSNPDILIYDMKIKRYNLYLENTLDNLNFLYKVRILFNMKYFSPILYFGSSEKIQAYDIVYKSVNKIKEKHIKKNNNDLHKLLLLEKNVNINIKPTELIISSIIIPDITHIIIQYVYGAKLLH